MAQCALHLIAVDGYSVGIACGGGGEAFFIALVIVIGGGLAKWEGKIGSDLIVGGGKQGRFGRDGAVVGDKILVGG